MAQVALLSLFCTPKEGQGLSHILRSSASSGAQKNRQVSQLCTAIDKEDRTTIANRKITTAIHLLHHPSCFMPRLHQTEAPAVRLCLSHLQQLILEGFGPRLCIHLAPQQESSSAPNGCASLLATRGFQPRPAGSRSEWLPVLGSSDAAVASGRRLRWR